MVVLRERILNLVPLYSLVCGIGGSVVVDVFNLFPTVHAEIRFCMMLPSFRALFPQQGYLTPNDLKIFNPSSNLLSIRRCGFRRNWTFSFSIV
jgi:hypothetical protein